MTTASVSFAHDAPHLDEHPDRHSPDSRPADNGPPGRETPSHAAPFADDWIGDEDFGEENEVEMDTEAEEESKPDREEHPRQSAFHEVSQPHPQSVADVRADAPSSEPTKTPVHADDIRELTPSEPGPAPVAVGPVSTLLPAPQASATSEARELLDGVAESLRTLGGRGTPDTDGRDVAIFPRGVDLLEVRLHLSRDRAIDLNFRVAGPTASIND